MKVLSVVSSAESESSSRAGSFANNLISILFEVLGPIGHGPSSSHTMAPQRAAYVAFKLLGRPPDEADVLFFNSFAATGEGHRSDIAIAAGLLGMNPDEENPRFRDSVEVARQRGMNLKFQKIIDKDEHPNTIVLRLTGGTDNLEMKIVSTGGGRFEVPACRLNGKDFVNETPNLEPSFNVSSEKYREALSVFDLALLESPLTFFGLAQRARDLRLDLSEFALMFETYIQNRQGLLHTPEQVFARAGDTLNVMLNAVRQGIRSAQKTAVTPGNWASRLARRSSHLGPLRTAYIGGIGAQEYNAGLGFVAAAPTCGASGTLPATLYYFKQEQDVTDDELVRALLVAGLIGLVAFSRGPVSGAQAGCGAEIGVAAMMSSGAAAFLMGGGSPEIGAAAALVGQNFQALECSPRGGFVEYPCIPRNGFAAVQAILSAETAVEGLSVPYMLDDVLTRIFVLGSALPQSLREYESGENMEMFLEENCCASGCSGCAYGG